MSFDFGDYVAISILGFFGLFVAFVFFVYLPVNVVTEAECLELGYPKHAVTWNLNKYCMNLEGSVTVAVDELE